MHSGRAMQSTPSTASEHTFTLGHSPDPDDAFMFYAMAEHKIDLGGFQFEHILQDIQTLNERARRGELDITAVSIHAYAYLLDTYALLPSGASMGVGYGPILLAKDRAGLPDNADHETIRQWLTGKTIAVPGEMTSATLALRLFGGETVARRIAVPFDRIFEAVLKGEADAGVCIHEGQLTYAEEGLNAILDLGVWWSDLTGLPLPLGGNVIKKSIAPETRSRIAVILRESIAYGLEHRREGVLHSMPLGRGLDEKRTDQFIGMYVNDLTLDYGERGRRAISEFLGRASDAGLIPTPVDLEFVEYPDDAVLGGS